MYSVIIGKITTLLWWIGNCDKNNDKNDNKSA